MSQIFEKKEKAYDSHVWGFIQAGGRSSRMGEDKAWLAVEGRPMIERVIAAARPVVDGLVLVVNAANPQLARYQTLAESYQAQVIHDRHDHRGPLGGIATALAHCEDDRSASAALILACDMPFMTSEFLAFLLQRHLHHLGEANQLTLPLDQEGRLQPLAGSYSASCRSAVELMLKEDDLRVENLCRRVPTRRLAFAEFAGLKDADRLFVNVNSREEYAKETRNL